MVVGYQGYTTSLPFRNLFNRTNGQNIYSYIMHANDLGPRLHLKPRDLISQDTVTLGLILSIAVPSYREIQLIKNIIAELYKQLHIQTIASCRMQMIKIYQTPMKVAVCERQHIHKYFWFKTSSLLYCDQRCHIKIKVRSANFNFCFLSTIKLYCR